MNLNVTLDKAGRVVIPKKLRDELRLDAGDTLELETHGEAMTLRPVRTSSRLRKDRGIWVFYSGKSIAPTETDAVLRSIREERGTW